MSIARQLAKARAAGCDLSLLNNIRKGEDDFRDLFDAFGNIEYPVQEDSTNPVIYDNKGGSDTLDKGKGIKK